ncbi:MAG: hypothetical protein ABUL62_04450 [Myxococcales bacterium]
MNHDDTALDLDQAVRLTDELERRERCTPRPLFRSHLVRGSRKPTTQGLASGASVAGLRELADLKRAAFISLAIAKRSMARLDDPTVTPREREAMNFNLRQALRFTTELLAHSRGEHAAPTSDQTPEES